MWQHGIYGAVALPQTRGDRHTPACLATEWERFGKCQDEPTHWSRWEKRQLVGMDRLTSIGA